jgi:hypothetical protein
MALVIGLGSKSRVWVPFSSSDRVRVPKKSGFPPGFQVFGYKRNQNLGSGQVRVPFLRFGSGSGTKKVGFSTGLRVPEPITTWHPIRKLYSTRKELKAYLSSLKKQKYKKDILEKKNFLKRKSYSFLIF